MQKSGIYKKTKVTILNVGFVSAMAGISTFIPMNLMAVTKPVLACFYSKDSCMDGLKESGFSHCCPTGSTGTFYSCPSGCSGGGTVSTCNCDTVAGLSDTTGTYTGITCTVDGTAYTDECFSRTNTPSSAASCLTYL